MNQEAALTASPTSILREDKNSQMKAALGRRKKAWASQEYIVLFQGLFIEKDK